MPVAKRKVHHMDLEALDTINREVVTLTQEPHEYSKADGEQLELLLKDVVSRADNQDFEEAVPEKASLLVFKLATGQHYRAGNMRTALVAGLVFLLKNGYTIRIDSPELVSIVDKAGVAGASLDDVYEVMGRLSAKSATERRAWATAAKAAVKAHGKFLMDVASRRDDSQD